MKTLSVSASTVQRHCVYFSILEKEEREAEEREKEEADPSRKVEHFTYYYVFVALHSMWRIFLKG